MSISYTKRGWTNNSPPAINAANLGAMDDGLKNAVDALNNMGDAGQQAVKEIGEAPATTTGGKLVNKITEAGYSLAPATGTSNLDNIADGTNYKRVTADEKTLVSKGIEVTAQAPWTPPVFYYLDAARFHLERISGGRATIFYSASGKVPIEVVLLEAFTLADVSPGFSRTRANSTAYNIGELLQANGQLYEVTTAGTTGATPPTYPTTVGETVTDGTAVLTLRINGYNDLDPAFVVAGVKKAGLWVGRFQATVANGKPMVVPGQLPSAVSIDNMRAYCAAFGNGCRPMTGLDWSAIQKDALRKGVIPVGNTYYGRSHKSPELQWGGVRGDRARPGDTSITSNPYTLGGSAGKLWTHNREEWGVHDFVGNMVQWTDGYKLMDGQLYIAAYDNDPALLTAEGEASWIATGVFFDSPVAGDDAGTSNLGIPRLDAAVTNYTASVIPPRDLATIKADTRDLDYAASTWTSYSIQPGYDSIDFLSRRAAFIMGLVPKIRVNGPFPFSTSEGYGYMRNNGERFANRGGLYNGTSYAGPSACYFDSRRSNTYAFRPVFVV